MYFPWEGSVFETTVESWWMSLELATFFSSFKIDYGLTINNYRTSCALVIGVHFGPNIHSKMTLRTKSTYSNLSLGRMQPI